MTVLAIVRPNGLLATELREALDLHPEMAQEVRLVSDDDSEVGTLTEVAGAATLVGALDADDLQRVDVAVVFGTPEDYAAALDALPPGTTSIIVSTDIAAHDAEPIVAGVNLESARRGEANLSPHPAVVGLAHILHPLRDFGIESVAATLLEPASSYGKGALDEMFTQARDLLNFQAVKSEILPGQLAFNILDAADDPSPLAHQLRSVLPQTTLSDDSTLSLHLLRAGVFHSLGVSLHLRLTEDPGEAAVRDILEDAPCVALWDEETLGAIDVASRPEVIVGRVEAQGKGLYRLWSMMDNIAAGGVGNALAILEALTFRPVA
ncbi:MAG: hypothetical protein MPN21_27730 [Thermoanaerobaculia bacterium]|nr:hypothetical protein [Thermoanaerobaculia bacterium]